MLGPIPCSVNMLTRNSAATLEMALASLSDFGEIVIADGRSSDATRALAGKFGCRVIDQDARYLDGEGRLLDFGGARGQLIAISSFDWILYLDSDEVLTREAAATIAAVLSKNNPAGVGAYRLRAKHVVQGVIIEDGSKAEWREARLLRRSAMNGFVGCFDEQIELLPGFDIQDLDAVFLKPVPAVRHLMEKWPHYLRVYAIESIEKGPGWTRQQLSRRKSSVRWLIRDWFAAKRRKHPARMPFRYEFAQVLFESLAYVCLRLADLLRRPLRKRTVR